MKDIFGTTIEVGQHVAVPAPHGYRDLTPGRVVRLTAQKVVIRRCNVLGHASESLYTPSQICVRPFIATDATPGIPTVNP